MQLKANNLQKILRKKSNPSFSSFLHSFSTVSKAIQSSYMRYSVNIFENKLVLVFDNSVFNVYSDAHDRMIFGLQIFNEYGKRTVGLMDFKVETIFNNRDAVGMLTNCDVTKDDNIEKVTHPFQYFVTID